MVEEAELPTVTPPERYSPTRSDAVAGIVLAAGTSSRFGDANKLLAEIDGESVITRSVQSLVDSGITPVYVIVGSDRRQVREAIESREARTIVNEAYADGQATSVRTGIESVRRHASVDAAVVSLGDMPFVNPATIDRLVAAYRSNDADIVVAAYRGQRGNPVLFDASYFGALSTLSGDTGARHLVVGSDDAVLVETGDPGVIRDIDTPTDLNRFARIRSDP
ncbi:nucleotidyltransferase family protein [Halalkalicoccus sp. NIPERK01]|uniref:nucleotidyltransferase family protein n=1 Tax=Halalkalicoccus sp. NIPERK01 TaxID=3053469 RepID=UPI00256F28EA|nr:nucleotidyltransferase family protein [Halalkalicoccus sp. NIPERK01]MDL5363234.1 nucleotidyltransferase family protein [Halalkalicoccus sp. NIPERK01]